MRRILLAFLMLSPYATSVWAFDFEVDGICYNVTSEEDKTVSVTSKESPLQYLGDVVIPSSVDYNGNTYSVTSIGDNAFYECSQMTSIVIPSSVISIGDEAFRYCVGLNTIDIPSSVTTISDYAFYICYSLEKIKIPSSVTHIGKNAFTDCFRLTSIEVESGNEFYNSNNNCNAIIETGTNTLLAGCMNTVIPDNVTSIGDGAFSGCEDLKSISLPSGLISIGSSAFAYCKLTSLELPESVEEIGGNAFLGCSSLTSIIIPKNVTSIEYGAFAFCSGVMSIKVDSENKVYDSRDNCNAIIRTDNNELIAGCFKTLIPNDVTVIADSAFFGCDRLRSIEIPSGVTSIGRLAFYICDNLTSIVIHEGVTLIDEMAFSGCSRLTSLSISSTTDVVEGAFNNCDIKRFFFKTNDDNVVMTLFDGAFNKKDFIDNKTVVFVPSELVSDYSATYEGVNFMGYNESDDEIISENQPEWYVDLDENSIEFIAETVNSGETLFGQEVSISLSGDLNLSGSKASWISLGTKEHPFKGEFNGNGHVLTLGNEEFYSNVDNSLFGVISENAVVKNIMVKDVYVDYAKTSDIKSDDNTETYYALLAKINKGVIKNCVVKGNIADMDDESAVACLVADNIGTIDHCVAYFTGLTYDANKNIGNKRKIIVMQNIGVGRNAGRVLKTASNGKRRKRASKKSVEPISAPKFTSDEIGQSYRLYTDEEMATGEPAYWLNMTGEGYSGEYEGNWSMSLDGKYPVQATESNKSIVKVEYEIEGVHDEHIDRLNFDGASYARIDDNVLLRYSNKPLQIKGGLSTIGDISSEVTIPEPNDKGVVTIALMYDITKSAVGDVTIPKTSINVSGHDVALSNVMGQEVTVTDVMGRQVYSKKAGAESLTLRLPSAGIYLVKVGEEVRKIVVR